MTRRANTTRTQGFAVEAAMRSPAPDLGPRAQRTIARILEATRQVFLERGYAGTTIDEIAKTAGISRGSVYTYFPSKRDMLLALGANSADEVEAVFDRFQHETDGRRLSDFRVFVDEYWEVLALHGAFALGWTQAAYEDDEIRTAGMARHLSMCRQLGAILTGPTDGDDPTPRGLTFSALIERTWSYAKLYAGAIDPEQLRDEIAQAMFTHVHGRAAPLRAATAEQDAV